MYKSYDLTERKKTYIRFLFIFSCARAKKLVLILHLFSRNKNTIYLKTKIDEIRNHVPCVLMCGVY